MTRKTPVITGKELVKALTRIGFVKRDQKGSHLHMLRESDRRRLTVPMHASRDIPSGTLKAILKDAGISAEELRDLLK